MPRKGQKHSDKTKKLLSEQKKGSKNPAYGKPPWNKGLTKETDERVAKNAANTSKGSRHLKPTDEARKAASERWKGDKNPAKDPEVIKKRVETRHKRYEHWQPDGFTSWCKGLTKEDDERLRIIGEKNSKHLLGRTLPDSSKEKLMIFWHNEENRKKQSITIKEKWENPTYRTMMETARIGKYLSGENHPMKNPENRVKLPHGKDHWNWHGGISYIDYYVEFNEPFKEYIRTKFNYKCAICNKSEEENIRKLSIHHVNYNRKTMCNKYEWLFLPLCDSCHMKTGFNRHYWFNLLANQWALHSEINFNTSMYEPLEINILNYCYCLDNKDLLETFYKERNLFSFVGDVLC